MKSRPGALSSSGLSSSADTRGTGTPRERVQLPSRARWGCPCLLPCHGLDEVPAAARAGREAITSPVHAPCKSNCPAKSGSSPTATAGYSLGKGPAGTGRHRGVYSLCSAMQHPQLPSKPPPTWQTSSPRCVHSWAQPRASAQAQALLQGCKCQASNPSSRQQIFLKKGKNSSSPHLPESQPASPAIVSRTFLPIIRKAESFSPASFASKWEAGLAPGTSLD